MRVSTACSGGLIGALIGVWASGLFPASAHGAEFNTEGRARAEAEASADTVPPEFDIERFGASANLDGLFGGIQLASDPLETAAEQIEIGEFRPATIITEQIISEIELTSTRYNPDLVRPLTLLGDARLGMGDSVGALAAYDRALHVSRVNFGLHSAEQVEVIYREAHAYIVMGDKSKANGRHEYAYQTLLRAHGATSPKLIPGLFTLAEWYQSTYNIFSARGLYEHAAYVAELNLEPSDPQLLKALRGLANTYRLERFPPYERPSAADLIVPMPRGYREGSARYTPLTVNNFAPGERALVEIVNIMQRDPTKTPADLAAAIVDLADWFLLFEKYQRAFPLYGHAWTLLEKHDLNARDATFKVPVPLYLALPGDPKAPPSEDRGEPTDGFVQLSFAVTSRGIVSGLETIGSEPEGMMDFKVRRATRRARYRPAFVDGEAVKTKEIQILYNFRYYPRISEAAQPTPG